MQEVFAKTLTYICEHNEQGALGLVVNRPTDLSVEKQRQTISLEQYENTKAELTKNLLILETITQTPILNR